MKITLKELRSLIRESVKSELQSSQFEPLFGAIKERTTKEPKYIDFVQDIFETYKSNPYNIKTDKGEPFETIYGDDKKAAIEVVFHKLGLTEEQQEKLLNPRGYIATFFGNSFSIKLENLAALAKLAAKEFRIDLETVEPSGSIDEKKEAELKTLGLSEEIVKKLMEKFPLMSVGNLKQLGEKLATFNSEPKAQQELLNLILRTEKNLVDYSIRKWKQDRDKKMRRAERDRERRAAAKAEKAAKAKKAAEQAETGTGNISLQELRSLIRATVRKQIKK